MKIIEKSIRLIILFLIFIGMIYFSCGPTPSPEPATEPTPTPAEDKNENENELLKNPLVLLWEKSDMNPILVDGTAYGWKKVSICCNPGCFPDVKGHQFDIILGSLPNQGLSIINSYGCGPALSYLEGDSFKLERRENQEHARIEFATSSQGEVMGLGTYPSENREMAPFYITRMTFPVAQSIELNKKPTFYINGIITINYSNPSEASGFLGLVKEKAILCLLDYGFPLKEFARMKGTIHLVNFKATKVADNSVTIETSFYIVLSKLGSKP